LSFPAIILAGGKSKRMGRDKATIEINGVPLITHVIDNLKLAGCKKVIIQIKSKQQQINLAPLISGVEITWGFDNEDNGGVVEALYCALKIAKVKNWKVVQLVPIDTPYVNPNFFKKINKMLDENLDVLIPSSNSSKEGHSNGLEPLLSFLKVEPVLSEILKFGNNKKRRLGEIFCETNYKIITQNQWEKWGVSKISFKNLNYPNDLE